MKFHTILAVLALSFTITTAQAGSNWNPYLKWGFGFDSPRPDRPLLETGKEPHNIQWEFDNENWSPAEWADFHRGDTQEMLNRLMDAGIVTDQYKQDGVPVLEVGQPYLRLSGLEKRRVAEYIDFMYGVTKEREDGMFLIYREDTDEEIGYFTKHGLQLQ